MGFFFIVLWLVGTVSLRKQCQSANYHEQYLNKLMRSVIFEFLTSKMPAEHQTVL